MGPCFWFVLKQCWQHRNVLIIAEQYLHSVKAFSSSHTTHQWLSRGYFSNKSWGKEGGRGDIWGYSWGPACLEMAKHLPAWAAVNKFLILLCLHTKLCFINLYLSPWVFSVLSHPTAGETASSCAGLICLLELTHNTAKKAAGFFL